MTSNTTFMQTALSCLFINVLSQNAALAFDKLNSCLLDVQNWMLASIVRLNPHKMRFIIFGSKAQFKKLNPISLLEYLVILCIRQFLETILMCGLMLISPLLSMFAIFVRHTSFKFMISGGLGST